MAGKQKKYKCLYLMKIFLEETDEDHGLSMAELNEKLAGYGFDPVSAKTLYEDIDELRNFGIDVDYSHQGRYYFYRVLNREFDIAELKLLVDSVQASKYITEKKSTALIKKITKLASQHQEQELTHQVLLSGRIKSMNESIFLNIDALNSAINLNSQIQFQYFQYDLNKNEVLRHDGAWYEVSPWGLTISDEYYYLVGFDEKDKKLKHYRVDKMLRIKSTGMPRNGAAEYHPEDYTKNSVFGMFGGKVTRITLEAENWMAGILIDRFGKDIKMVPVDEQRFEVGIDVALSLQFYGWLFGLGPSIRLTGPTPAINEFRKHIRTISKGYSNCNENVT